MRVAILVPMMSGRGGSETAVAGLVQGLQSLGDEAHVYLFGGLPKDPRWLEPLPYTVLGSPTEKRLRRFHRYIFGLAKEFKRFSPDAVVALDSLRLVKGKLALTLSGSNASLLSFIEFPVDHIRMNRLLKIADGHLAIGEGVAGQLKDLVGKSCSDRVFTIYNPILLNCSIVARPANGEGVAFLHVGRLEFAAQKRVADLLAAASRLGGNFRLTIIGDGNDRSRLEEYSRELGLQDRVTWLGWKVQPWASVERASVLLLVSSYEGFPLILLEALSRGIPCIASDCKYGPNEILENGTNGWLYPVGDIDRLTELMQAVVDNPRILPAPEDVLASAQKFSAQAVAERARLAFATLAKPGAPLHPQVCPADDIPKN
jgi:UDP-D-galactose:(glucosyl)LPS alpha-1,6-D-galactosyltransferase